MPSLGQKLSLCYLLSGVAPHDSYLRLHVQQFVFEGLGEAGVARDDLYVQLVGVVLQISSSCFAFGLAHSDRQCIVHAHILGVFGRGGSRATLAACNRPA